MVGDRSPAWRPACRIVCRRSTASLRHRPEGRGVAIDGVTPAHESAPSGLLAGRVHPRWLSWGLSRTQDWGLARAGPGPSPRADRRPCRSKAVVASCPPVREIDLPAACMRALSELCPPNGSVPVARPMPSCGRRCGAPTPAHAPLQGVDPRPEFRSTWRVGRLLS
jgi:hypothetical protein